MKRWLAVLLLLFMVTLWPGAAKAEVQVPPRPTSGIYVQDYAGVLGDEAKTRIRSLGAKLAGQTKAQVIVVTIPTLDGANPDEFGLAILRQWGVGDRKLNNGVVMLVAVNDRVSRIEVGYGLEGALPDGKTGRIQDEQMLPFFKQGKYEAGIVNGYQALTAEVAREYKVELKAGERRQNTQAVQSTSWFDEMPLWLQILLGLAVIALLLLDWMFFGGNITLLLINLISMGRRGGGGGGDGFGGGSGGGGGSSRNW